MTVTSQFHDCVVTELSNHGPFIPGDFTFRVALSVAVGTKADVEKALRTLLGQRVKMTLEVIPETGDARSET